ncbi:hypothetical protein GpartN1_g2302.t1 [Galdieria partita]|uniref:RING-type domain-containing protein n=1 Tax=Galdieria partita TaxID=83374 RepID=A0A9C7UPF0_9RHOD|nr:hypothetical protein GpartN1_g2302.t1 [Galdieria partita]
MSANASPAEIILACFSVSIAAMILTGVGCSINNHIRRRRGLRGFLDSPSNVRAHRRRTMSRAARRREKGLSAYEVEIYCPEIIYKGPLETPLLFWEEDEEVLTPTQVEQKAYLEPPSPVATKEQLALEEKVVDNVDVVYRTTSWFTECERNSEAETTGARTERLKYYFLGQHILPDGVCAVCLEVVEKDGHLRLLPCGHAFHVHCITHWLSYGTRCPLCNETVRLTDHERTRSGSTQHLSSVQLNSGNVDSSPQTLPLFMAAGHTVYNTQPNREQIQSVQDPETISKEVVMQSFERIRLRLYERYLERQQKTHLPRTKSLDAVVVDGEVSQTRSVETRL